MIKKTLTALLVVTVLIAVVGCGGGGGKKGRGYYYEWSTSTSSEKYSMAAPQEISGAGVVLAGYTSSTIPPYASVSLLDGSAGAIAVIYTYYEDDVSKSSQAVSSFFSCDTSNGDFVTLDGTHHSTIESTSTMYYPQTKGIHTITATWSGQTLNIPIRVYEHLELNYYSHRGKNAYDFDDGKWYDDATDPRVDLYVDKINGRVYTPYGSLTVSTPFSALTNPPLDGYNTTEREQFTAETLILKTSSGKLVKTYMISANPIHNNYGVRILTSVSNDSGSFNY